MSDPRRWILDGAGLSRDERKLLRAAAAENIDPPEGAKANVWAALVMQIGPGGGSPPPGPEPGGAGPAPAVNAGASAAGGGAASAGAGAAGGSAVKTVVIGAALAGAIIAGYFAFAPSEPDSIAGSAAPAMSAAQSAPLSPPSPENQAAPAPPQAADDPAANAPPLKPLSSAARPNVEPHGSRALGPRPAPHKSDSDALPAANPAADQGAPQPAASSAPADRASRLREESQLLSEARDALRRGDPSAALRKLEDSRTRFSGGVLVQEREALTIEALYKGGQRAAAADQAASFLRTYPLSPHAARIQQFAH